MLNSSEVRIFLSIKANFVALSRMEKYLAVIKVLENGDLITQKQIMQEANVKLESPKEVLDAQLIVEKILETKEYMLSPKKMKDYTIISG